MSDCVYVVVEGVLYEIPSDKFITLLEEGARDPSETLYLSEHAEELGHVIDITKWDVNDCKRFLTNFALIKVNK